MRITEDISILQRSNLTPLFANHKHLRPSIDAILQGHCGRAVADNASDPHVAQISVAPCVFFGGDPKHPVARDLIENLSGDQLILLDGDAWQDLVFETLGARVTLQQWTAFSWDSLDRQHLRRLASRVPEGFHIERIDVDLASRIPSEVGSHLIMSDVFQSSMDFVECGFGFCAINDEGQVVCAAISAIVSNTAMEVQINTSKPCRQMGLATVVGAALIDHSLELGIEPHWDTSSNASARLARILGYVEGETYEVLELSSPSGGDHE